MMTRIRDYFRDHLQSPDLRGDRDPDHALRLAAAALLLEMSRMDPEAEDAERDAVTAAVREHMRLSHEEAEELIGCAEEERAQATDYFQFTSLINRSYTSRQKAQLVELLWRVAFADERLHMYEEHLVRRIADLLYVPHSAFIAAKHRAANEA
jgi:uncharacterized tellurite resistance protein B-like protein